MPHVLRSAREDERSQKGAVMTISASLAGNIWEAAPDGMLLVDDAGAVRLANAEACRLFGYDIDDLVGKGVDELLPASLRAGHLQHRRTYREDPKRRSMGIGVRLLALRGDGTEIAVEVGLSPMVLDGVAHTVAAVRDMTDREIVEAQLVDATRRRLLSDERERVARDLHDTVIQELFAVGMHLQSTLSEVESDSVAARIDGAIDEVDNVISRIRAVIFDARRVEEQTDVRDEVVEVVAQMTPMLGFEPNVIFTGDFEAGLSNDVVGELIPIVREALTNVAKHADASTAEVSLAIGDALHLSIVDDGRGIESGAPKGNGLGNLTRRAVILGGELTVRVVPEGGTALYLKVPLQAR